MSVRLPNGALLHIASGYGAAVDITDITNADPGVIETGAAHGLVVGDIYEIVANWSRLTNKVVRAGAVADVTHVSLEGIDTTSTSIYSAGSGGGSGATLRKITGWTQLQQILDTDNEGGEQQFHEWQFLEADMQSRMPTTRTAEGIKIIVADDPALAGFVLASEANDDRQQRALRLSLPGGSKIFYNAWISVRKMPTLKVNNLMACEVNLSLLNEVVRYAA